MITLDINKPILNYVKIWNSLIAYNTQTTRRTKSQILKKSMIYNLSLKPCYPVYVNSKDNVAYLTFSIGKMISSSRKIILLHTVSYILKYEVSVEMHRLHFLIIYLLSPRVKDEEKKRCFLAS